MTDPTPDFSPEAIAEALRRAHKALREIAEDVGVLSKRDMAELALLIDEADEAEQ